MKLYNNNLSYYFILLLLISGCGNHSAIKEEVPVDTEQFIRISQKQAESEKIEFGEATLMTFKEVVKCNGYIMSPSNGMARISTPVTGIVETVNCSLGDYVKKGAVLCTISSNELMIIQQDFAETSARLIRLKADYDRIKALFEEKISAEKDFLAIESEYKAMTAKYHALKIRLEIMRLNSTKIENGDFISAYRVVSPINGYITDLNIVLGQFVELQRSIIEIVDTKQLQLILSIFQQDITKLKQGQSVDFNSIGEPESAHSGKIIAIGRTVDPDSRVIKCIAAISNEKEADFINQSYVEASVIVNQSDIKALPSEAILKSDDDYYVFVVDKFDDEGYSLRKVKVNVGRIYNGFSEIIDGEFAGKILVNGVYNLQSEL